MMASKPVPRSPLSIRSTRGSPKPMSASGKPSRAPSSAVWPAPSPDTPEVTSLFSVLAERALWGPLEASSRTGKACCQARARACSSAVVSVYSALSGGAFGAVVGGITGAVLAVNLPDRLKTESNFQR